VFLFCFLLFCAAAHYLLSAAPPLLSYCFHTFASSAPVLRSGRDSHYLWVPFIPTIVYSHWFTPTTVHSRWWHSTSAYCRDILFLWGGDVPITDGC
jgi:hypothetical protein